MLAVLLLSLCCATAAGVEAAESEPVASREELVAAVGRAKPGTTILIAPGSYRGGLTFANLRGEAGRPIVLAAADAKNAPVISGGANGIHLVDPLHVELRDLVIEKTEANGLNVDDGGSYDTPARNVVLRGIVVRDVGGDGNHDGIKLSGVDAFSIERCVVERWGRRGSAIDMVGCHDGSITDCTFRDGGETQANAVQTKGGSRDIAVRSCRFENAGARGVNIGGSTGRDYFRPTGANYEAKDITVEDCTFIGSQAPLALVGVDGATVRHNTLYHPTRWVLRILQESQGPQFVRCRNGRFTRNVIVFRDGELATAVNIGPETSPETFEFAENFWFCENRPDRTRSAVKLPTEEPNGKYGLDPKFRDARRFDLRFEEESPAEGFGARK